MGICPCIADETEITQSHPTLPPPASAPPPGPPRFLLEDVWPWLALLGAIAVAGLLTWLFVIHPRSGHGKTVPAVVGARQQDAIATLEHDGFGVRAIVQSASRPRGIVVSQTPGGGARLDKGQTVTIHVSNGRPLTGGTQTTATTTAQTATAATTTQAQSGVAVPDVTGEAMASGAGQIEAAGFVADTAPVSATEPPGSVVQEDPAAGTQVAAGGVVRLSVAVGANRPPTQVPDVVGQKASAARATLLDAKLTVQTVFKRGPAKSIGIVLAESPAGTLPAYSQVTLTVGR